MGRVLPAAIAGFVVLAVWTVVANGLLGFTARVTMGRLAEERPVYEILAASVVEPGVYVVNPETAPERGYPPDEPVFTVSYAGFGHEAAGRMLWLDLGIVLASLMLAAGLLSAASMRVLGRYWRRFAFIVSVGLLLAISCDLARIGIGGFPVRAAVQLAAFRLVSWALVGLVMAGIVRGRAVGANPA